MHICINQDRFAISAISNVYDVTTANGEFEILERNPLITGFSTGVMGATVHPK